jgi:hypothetical protein
VCTLECDVALHVDTITFGNGTCEVSLEFTEDFPEDQVNVIKELTEAPNQSSEDIDISDFRPTSKGKPRTYPTTLLHCNLCLSILYLALSLGIEVKP